MLEVLLAGYFNISATNSALIAQRKPEHDAILKLTPKQQQDIDLIIADCQKRPEVIDLDCQMSYQELADFVKSWDTPRYDRPNLCDKFESLPLPWTEQQYIELSKLDCSIGE